ncbi:carboxylesterase family protein [Streptomyces atratus]|uniref:Carboxylesterase family protein n=1 Tax=Streptomyces atratus TaxID=1893 RepID=A0A1K2A455_STRAR|nr:carboxylesterase family protein [Streptomyces atratus]SFX81250.1 Carboxylesterase family protein [Streptomyces atratus]
MTAVKGWDGTRQATEFGPVVPQAGPTAESSAGNDWLTLNVSTPALGTAGLPVPVWIHGGACIAGASSDPMYDPAALTSAGLVAVSGPLHPAGAGRYGSVATRSLASTVPATGCTASWPER